MQDATRLLALRRAGYDTVEEFAAGKGLEPTLVDAALMPYVVGYEIHRIRPGDTFAALSRDYGTTEKGIRVANPGKSPQRLQIGQLLVIPLGFPVVPEDVPISSELLHYLIRGLQARYPMLRQQVIGRTAGNRPLELVRLGEGPRVVYYNAAHHANEWLTTPLVLRCLEEYVRAAAYGQKLMGLDAAELLENTSLLVVPMVNPDGVDLVVGAATEQEWNAAREIAAEFPEIPFPDGWKANLRGVDLNLNYPARWDQAREIKYEQGFDIPAPRDYVGSAPLSEAESRAMFDSTEEISPELTIAWHTQGEEIYWKFLDLEPEGARRLGQQMAAASGYSLEEVPYASSFAGYKDWFIQDFDRPGYTIEAGSGTNPLPVSQLPEMVRDNLPIFLLGLTGAMEGAGNEEPVAAMVKASGGAPKREKPKQLGRGGSMEAAWG